MRIALVIGAAAAIAFSAMAAAAAPATKLNGGANGNSDAMAARPLVDTGTALVQLKGDPLSTYEKAKPPQGKKIDFSSNTVKAYRAQLNQLRNDFRKWLQVSAPAARVTGQFDISLNAVSVQLNGTSLDLIRTAPQVQAAEYEGLYYPTADDPDLGLIHAIDAWTAGSGTSASAGAGVKVAIVDTGIDITHPCFSDAGYPTQTQLGEKAFTNNKVIVAKVFNNKTPGRAYTAEALQEHGTHVAGTVACNAGTTATVEGATIPFSISGVAPHALLGNYNIFPGDVTNARSEDILNALDAAYADGMDVANMSLGGGASGIKDLLSMAVDNLDQANMVIAVAAGNSAQGNAEPPHLQAAGHYTIESPGSAARALTAGASTVGHFVSAQVLAPSGNYLAASGDFATVKLDTAAPLAVTSGGGMAGLDQACSALSGDYTGKIVLVVRGTCAFSVKIRNVQAAHGAVALVVNNVAGDPIAMGTDGTPDQPTIPAYMISLGDGTTIKADDGSNVTIPVAQTYVRSSRDDIMAAFSSEGPTDVDFRVKPDVVAPGVNVLSSIPHQFCDTPPCFAFFQGTSMATPHLAGSAAVVLWAHPTWSAAQVRSAIVNTADQNVLKDEGGINLAKDVNSIGAGRENLLSAVNAAVALDPVSVSFGSVPSGAGQTRTFTVNVSNLGGQPTGVAVDDHAGGGITFGATLSGGSITVTMTADKGAAPGDHQAILRVLGAAGEVAHAAVYVFVK